MKYEQQRFVIVGIWTLLKNTHRFLVMLAWRTLQILAEPFQAITSAIVALDQLHSVSRLGNVVWLWCKIVYFGGFGNVAPACQQPFFQVNFKNLILFHLLECGNDPWKGCAQKVVKWKWKQIKMLTILPHQTIQTFYIIFSKQDFAGQQFYFLIISRVLWNNKSLKSKSRCL